MNECTYNVNGRIIPLVVILNYLLSYCHLVFVISYTIIDGQQHYHHHNRHHYHLPLALKEHLYRPRFQNVPSPETGS